MLDYAHLQAAKDSAVEAVEAAKKLNRRSDRLHGGLPAERSRTAGADCMWIVCILVELGLSLLTGWCS